MLKKYSYYFLLLSMNILLLTNHTYAENFIKQTQIDGTMRSYYFSRFYNNPIIYNQNAYSLGGDLNILTGAILPGLQAGATLYTAQPLGLNSDKKEQVDNTLPGFPVTVLGQAYLQYHNNSALIKIGNQIMNTPWLNAADSRIIPATYQGLYGLFNLWQNLKITTLRVWSFKGRTADYFSQTNLYNSINIGGTGIPAYGNTKTPGALAFGAHYQLSRLTTETWYYQFYDIAQLAYAEATYIQPLSSINLVISAQIAKEWEDDKNFLAPYTGGLADANAYGLLLGLKTQNAGFDIGYNLIPTHSHAALQGDLLSPYTSGYSSDPLYTTSMVSGLITIMSGQAIKISSHYFMLHHQLQLLISFAKYFTAPRLPNSSETDLDITYHLRGKLRGFSIRNRIGLLDSHKPNNPFIYNRFMLQYNF